MDRSNGRDTDRVRPDHPGQGVNLSGMVHADLKHSALRITRHTRQRQGHANMVVIGLDRGVGAAGHGQPLGHRLGQAGLADRACDGPSKGCTCPIARGNAHLLQSDQNIGNQHGGTCHCARRQRPRRPLCKRLLDKFVAVSHARQGDEQIALVDGARIDGQAHDLKVGTDGLAARGLSNFGRCPERAGHATGSRPRAAAASDTSSKGWTTPAMV